MDKKRQIFISYSRKDLALVKSFVREIEDRVGVRPWVDLSGIETGAEFEDVIVRAIDDCDVLVFVISQNSLGSPWTKKEVLYARAKGKRICPVIIDGCKLDGWFLFEFSGTDCADYSNPDQREKLMCTLAECVKRPLRDGASRKVPSRAFPRWICLAVMLAAVGATSLFLFRMRSTEPVEIENPRADEQDEDDFLREKAIDGVKYTFHYVYPEATFDDRGSKGWFISKVEFPQDLEKIIMPDEIDGVPVLKINSYCFRDCGGLKEIQLPKHLRDVGHCEFYGCTSLRSIYIPDGCKSMGVCCESCPALEHVDIPAGVDFGAAFRLCDNIVSVNLRGDLKAIGSRWFQHLRKLKSVTIPETVTSIGRSAFYECSSLVEVKLPPALEEIGEDAFRSCSGLERIELPSGVKSIGDNAFSGCMSLSSVSFPAKMDSLGSSAFRNCKMLTEVSLPSVRELPVRLFMGCYQLSSVTFADGLERISAEAFKDCESLTSIQLPENVQVEYGAFSGCNSLSESNRKGSNGSGESQGRGDREKPFNGRIPIGDMSHIFEKLNEIHRRIPELQKQAFEKMLKESREENK